MNKIILFLAFIFFTFQDVMSQCVMCKATAEAQAEESGSGINAGIIYIMIIPYIILFIVFHKKIFSLLKSLKSRDF